MSADTGTMYVKHRDELEAFDHDPIGPHFIHGDTCVRGCKPVDRIVVESYLHTDGTPITDPELLGKIRAKELREA